MKSTHDAKKPGNQQFQVGHALSENEVKKFELNFNEVCRTALRRLRRGLKTLQANSKFRTKRVRIKRDWICTRVPLTSSGSWLIRTNNTKQKLFWANFEFSMTFNTWEIVSLSLQFFQIGREFRWCFWINRDPPVQAPVWDCRVEIGLAKKELRRAACGFFFFFFFAAFTLRKCGVLGFTPDTRRYKWLFCVLNDNIGFVGVFILKNLKRAS